MRTAGPVQDSLHAGLANTGGSPTHVLFHPLLEHHQYVSRPEHGQATHLVLLPAFTPAIAGWLLDRSLLCCSGDVAGLGQRAEGTGECGIDASRGLLIVCRGRARCVPMAEECPCPVVPRTAVYEGVVFKGKLA